MVKQETLAKSSVASDEIDKNTTLTTEQKTEAKKIAGEIVSQRSQRLKELIAEN